MITSSLKGKWSSMINFFITLCIFYQRVRERISVAQCLSSLKPETTVYTSRSFLHAFFLSQLRISMCLRFFSFMWIVNEVEILIEQDNPIESQIFFNYSRNKCYFRKIKLNARKMNRFAIFYLTKNITSFNFYFCILWIMFVNIFKLTRRNGPKNWCKKTAVDESK